MPFYRGLDRHTEFELRHMTFCSSLQKPLGILTVRFQRCSPWSVVQMLACLSRQHTRRVYGLYKQGLMKLDIYINVFLWNVISRAEYSYETQYLYQCHSIWSPIKQTSVGQPQIGRSCWPYRFSNYFCIDQCIPLPRMESNNFHVWALWALAWRIGVSF